MEAKFDLAEGKRIQSEVEAMFGKNKAAASNLETALKLYEIIWQTDKKNIESLNAILNAHQKLSELYKLENQPQKSVLHERESEKLKKEKNQNSPKS
jgi:hypothetical protein